MILGYKGEDEVDSILILLLSKPGSEMLRDLPKIIH